MKSEEEYLKEYRALENSDRYVDDDTVPSNKKLGERDDVAFNKGIEEYTTWLKSAISENSETVE